jgi:hypothetical protein
MGERYGGRVGGVERREEGVGEHGRKVGEDGATASIVEGRMRHAAPRGNAQALRTPDLGLRTQAESGRSV